MLHGMCVKILLAVGAFRGISELLLFYFAWTRHWENAGLELQ
jgi:hypothetical protein